MRIGEADHKLMSQLHYLEKWFVYRCHLNMSQSMHSSEQNLFGILCLTLFFLSFISGLRAPVLSCRGMSLTLEYIHEDSIMCSAGRTSFCLCNLCQLH